MKAAILAMVVVSSVACGDLGKIQTSKGSSTDSNVLVTVQDTNTKVANPAIELATVDHATAFPQANDPNGLGHIENETAWPMEGTIECHGTSNLGDVHYFANNDGGSTRTVKVVFNDKSFGNGEYQAAVSYDLIALASSPDLVKVDNAVWGAVSADMTNTSGRKAYFFVLDIITMRLFVSSVDYRSGDTVSANMTFNGCTYTK